MKARMIFAAAVGLALVVGAILGGWYVLRRQAPTFCEISGRPIHGNMHTVARVNGERCDGDGAEKNSKSAASHGGLRPQL